MKQFVALLSFVFFGLTDTYAQTFLEDIQKQDAGQGTVTVKESQEIDDLVNGKTPINVAPPKENKVQTQAKVEVPNKADAVKDKDDIAKNNETTADKKEKRIVKKNTVV